MDENALMTVREVLTTMLSSGDPGLEKPMSTNVAGLVVMFVRSEDSSVGGIGTRGPNAKLIERIFQEGLNVLALAEVAKRFPKPGFGGDGLPN